MFYKAVRPGIAFRMTAAFILVGLIIGYFTHLYYMMGSTHNFISVTSKTISEKYREISAGKPGDILLSAQTAHDPDFIYGMRLLHDFAYNPSMDISFTVNCFEKKSGRWDTIDISEERKIAVSETAENLIPELNRARSHKIRSSSLAYFGKSDKVSLFINITRPEDMNDYIISLSANRRSIARILSQNMYQTWAYAVLLILIAVSLGMFFGKRLSRPIEWIASEAEKVAAGDFDRTFTISRRDEIGRLGESLTAMSSEIKIRMAEIQRQMNAMETMNKIDKAVLSSISRYDLLDRVVNIVSRLFDDTGAAMALRNETRRGFDLLSVSENIHQDILARKPFIPDTEIPPAVAKSAIADCQCTIHSRGDASDIYHFYSRYTSVSPGAIAVIPVVIADKYLGSLFVARKEKHSFTDEDMSTLRMIADQVGVALHSVKSFEEKENLLLGIMLALTRSIDAKSKWTAGHSERVARLSEKIAQKMNLSSSEKRALSFSAILHDIGKIAVPERILDKPGKLTDEEYAVIKGHPDAGVHIIRDISLYEDIMPGILYHHEHWDGSGYPCRLRGRDIPHAGRIITIADVYDAITADRPYRGGMDKKTAAEFMIKNSGVIFDPEILAVFIEILNEEEKSGT
ncbi:MAG: HD domain-containing phosphohydrolase [Spirochaetota bacterium]